MTHSVAVARNNDHHLATTEQAVSVYTHLNENDPPASQTREEELPPTKGRKQLFTEEGTELVREVYFLMFERSELEGKYAPIVLGRHSSTSTVSA